VRLAHIVERERFVKSAQKFKKFANLENGGFRGNKRTMFYAGTTDGFINQSRSAIFLKI
jgi:hypothetical protein